MGREKHPTHFQDRRKKRGGGPPQRTNGLLAVELFSGECFFQAQPIARTEQIAIYFFELATYLQSQAYRQAHFFLDNNTTHLGKMRTLFQEQSSELSLEVCFHYFPKYSPGRQPAKLNIVEYLIHLIRQKWLHHSDSKQRLETLEKKLAQHLHQKVFLAPKNMLNILQYIQDLVFEN